MHLLNVHANIFTFADFGGVQIEWISVIRKIQRILAESYNSFYMIQVLQFFILYLAFLKISEIRQLYNIKTKIALVDYFFELSLTMQVLKCFITNSSKET